MTVELLDNLDPATTISRMFRYHWLLKDLRTHQLTFVSPSQWGDRFENLLASCAMDLEDNGGFVRQVFFDRTRRPVRAQCWSRNVDSEAQWRMYSGFRDYNAVPKRLHNQGALVVTTVGELRDTIRPPAGWKVFIGRVAYLPREELAQLFANEIGTRLGKAFGEDDGQARSLLFKRHHFEFEREVRVVAVPPIGYESSEDIQPIEIADTNWIHEIVMDPRLIPWVAKERADYLVRRGFARVARQTELRERHLYQVRVRIPEELGNRVRQLGPDVLFN